MDAVADDTRCAVLGGCKLDEKTWKQVGVGFGNDGAGPSSHSHKTTWTATRGGQKRFSHELHREGRQVLVPSNLTTIITPRSNGRIACPTVPPAARKKVPHFKSSWTVSLGRLHHLSCPKRLLRPAWTKHSSSGPPDKRFGHWNPPSNSQLSYRQS